MNSWSETLVFAKPLRDLLPQNRRQNDGARQGGTMAGAEEEANARYLQGVADGEKALSEKLYQQRAEMQELAQGLFESLRKAVPQVRRDTENQMISLALAVSQKLVADLPISNAMVEAAVREAVAQAEGTAQMTVRLHRDDLELLQKSDSPLLKRGEESNDFRLLASPEVTRGGCMVETNFGTIDARRETKLELLKRSLIE
jgi:flagellar biosynthesis/type III secretory pathway protein FliH